MKRNSVTVDEVVAVLNEALAADPDAVAALLANRVPCNKALSEHPTIQVGRHGGPGYQVGLLGILNGLFGVGKGQNGYGAITAIFDGTEAQSQLAFFAVRDGWESDE